MGLDYMAKQALGIYGRVSYVPIGNNTTVNRNGNDGTIARFGWKAQNKSLLIFSGEAYNVEMGISNELFQTERDETANCQAAPVANDVANLDAADPIGATGAIELFSDFMRFLAPPTPSTMCSPRRRPPDLSQAGSVCGAWAANTPNWSASAFWKAGLASPRAT